jgi:hypothetical protein
MAYSRKLREILNRSNAQIEAGEGIPADRFWSELAKTPAATPKRAPKSRVTRPRNANR